MDDKMANQRRHFALLSRKCSLVKMAALGKYIYRYLTTAGSSRRVARTELRGVPLLLLSDPTHRRCSWVKMDPQGKFNCLIS
jgi:hypothetical protein